MGSSIFNVYIMCFSSLFISVIREIRFPIRSFTTLSYPCLSISKTLSSTLYLNTLLPSDKILGFVLYSEN